MPTSQALAIAQEAGLDLVEVAPNAQPPVCRVMDFGKYVYEQHKKEKGSKAGAAKVKEVKFRPRVDTHDFMTKLRHGEEFLFHGNKVKLTLTFRGREMAHTEIGYETMRRAVLELGHIGHPDNEPKLGGAKHHRDDDARARQQAEDEVQSRRRGIPRDRAVRGRG